MATVSGAPSNLSVWLSFGRGWKRDEEGAIQDAIESAGIPVTSKGGIQYRSFVYVSPEVILHVVTALKAAATGGAHLGERPEVLAEVEKALIDKGVDAFYGALLLALHHIFSRFHRPKRVDPQLTIGNVTYVISTERSINAIPEDIRKSGIRRMETRIWKQGEWRAVQPRDAAPKSQTKRSTVDKTGTSPSASSASKRKNLKP